MTASHALLPRIRAAGLRVTLPRLSVLQVIDSVAPASICAEDVFRQCLLRGVQVSNGTVYRTIQQSLEAGLLLREWDRDRRARYRLRPAGVDTPMLRVVCPDTGRMAVLDDTQLRAAMVRAVRAVGLDFSEHVIVIAADSTRARRRGGRARGSPSGTTV